MISDRKLANAVGGKTARPCDNCIRRRARWYCAADDAFLCQDCDASVHSANPLARRHERVRLKTASNKLPREALLETSVPSWHHGFTRKARTPRHKKLSEVKFEEAARNSTTLHLVPEIFSDETCHEEHEEQLLYRVPTFDPFVAELCTSATSNEAANTILDDVKIAAAVENKREAVPQDCGNNMNDQLHGCPPSDMDLAQFAADVESLLGQGFDNESFDMEGLGLMDCKENDFINSSIGTGKVKIEEEDDDDNDNDGAKVLMAQDFDMEIDVTREPFMLNFDDNSLLTCTGEDVKVEADEQIVVKGCEDDDVKTKEKKISLRLNYDEVITAWADQMSPWTIGERPEFDSLDLECWPYCVGKCGKVHHYGDGRLMGYAPAMNVGREARVSRYREKRRTRLFSKKIRYEVRKLNAEKRPRMKGRFVKRANFAASSSFPLLAK